MRLRESTIVWLLARDRAHALSGFSLMKKKDICKDKQSRSRGRIERAATTKKLYGIRRRDDPVKREWHWEVWLVRRGQRFRKRFPDLRHGGKAAALRAAVAYRDQVIRDHAPMSRAEYGSVVRRNNNSGIPGVCRIERPRSRGQVSVYWIAFWPATDGQKVQIKFSARKLGDAKARELATEARQKAIAMMNDPHINSRGLRQWIRAYSQA